MTEDVKPVCIGGECRPEWNWKRTDCPVHGSDGAVAPHSEREFPPLAIKPYKNPIPKMLCSACKAPATSDHAIDERHDAADVSHSTRTDIVYQGCKAAVPGKFVWWFEGEEKGNDYVHFERAGNCVCSLCKRRYGKHPMAHGPAAQSHAGEPFLHVLCDGALVKL